MTWWLRRWIATREVASSTPDRSASCSHTRASVTKHAIQIGTGQMVMMSYGWEGSRRSGVALAIRHRLHLQAQGPSKGDEHPTNTPHGVRYSLPLPSPSFSVCTASAIALVIAPQNSVHMNTSQLVLLVLLMPFIVPLFATSADKNEKSNIKIF